MILSDGEKKSVIEYIPENYIKRFEKYFGISYNDKVYYQNQLKDLKEANQAEAEKILNSKFKLTINYAEKLIKNSSSAHYNIVKRRRIHAMREVYIYINILTV